DTVESTQQLREFTRRCFVDSLPAGERALATEGERYLHEPDGWRRPDAETVRTVADFVIFVEDTCQFDNYRLPSDSDEVEAGRCFLMKHVKPGENWYRDWLPNLDLWWHYPRGWILAFRRSLGKPQWEDRPMGYIPGERLTKQVKLFTRKGDYEHRSFIRKSDLVAVLVKHAYQSGPELWCLWELWELPD
ncbi:hypothetical protein AURDEDRAFT_177397, partial [Auricularia subglabra TFB-10046 SS5]